MNRQQAINYLLSSGFSEEQINTIEQAFKQEPTNDLVVDCISRQTVIDLMMQKWGENFSGDDAMQESIDAIREMPSVTPQEPCDKCEVTFKDDNAVSRLSVRDIIYANAYELEYPDSTSEYVINRDELIKYLMELPTTKENLADVEDCISRKYLKEDMIRYGWHHPDSTFTEYVESLPSIYPKSDNPKEEHTCETCAYGEWKRKGWTIDMADDKCGGCCSWNDKWEQIPSVYPKSEKPYDVVINYCVEHEQILIDKDKYENLQQLRKANNQLKKQIEMLKLDRDCDKPSGKWIKENPAMIERYPYCSKCGFVNPFDKLLNYCPNCGAKMVEPQESEDKG